MHAFLTEHFNAVLCWLGFQLLGGAQVRYQGKMHHQAVFLWQVPLQLPHCFNKRQAFNVAYGPPNFGNYNVVSAIFAQTEHAPFYFVGNVRHNLHGFAHVVARTLFVDYRLVNSAGRHIVFLAGVDVQKALIVSQIEIGFCAILGYVTLAVFVRV